MKAKFSWLLAILTLTAFGLLGQQTTPSEGGGSSSGGGSGSSSALQSSVPSKLPTGSVGEIQAYALEHTSQVRAGVGSESQVNGSRRTYVDKRINGAGAALALLASSSFEFNVENPKDDVYLWVWLYDDDDNAVVYGDARKKLVVAKGGNYRPEDLKITLRYAEFVPIAISDLRSAYVAIQDDKGKTIRHDRIEVRNGKMVYPVALAGNAPIHLFIGDDYTEYLYSKDGLQKLPEQVNTGGVDVSIDHTLFITDGNVNKVVVPSENGRGYNYVIELTLTKAQPVQFFAQTSEGASSTGYIIKKKGGAPVPWTVPKGYEVVQQLAEGTYYIWFSWDPQDFEPYDLYYAPPDNGGGKG
ncbi:MAG: hypothetical protein Q7R79_01875 [bacterium]|nr:hypothetical protein [bacterium]